MNRNQLYTFRALLIICGVLIIGAARFVIPFSGVPAWVTGFTYFSILLIYLAITMPFLLLRFTRGSADAEITGLGIYYKGTAVYAILSLIIIGLVFADNCSQKVAYIAQLCLVFILAVYTYLGLFTSHHILSSKGKEQKKTEELNRVKNLMKDIEVTLSMAEGLDSTLGDDIKHMMADIRYISPSDNKHAQLLEYQMVEKLSSLNSHLKNLKSINRDELKDEVDQLKLICMQRKNIY